MKLDEYTADAICRAIDLPGFVEDAWLGGDDRVLRVVLTPAFHPEVCITARSSKEMAYFSVFALKQKLWLEAGWRLLPYSRAEFSRSASTFEDVISLFEAMKIAIDPLKRMISIDGMGIESCLVSGKGVQRLRVHATNEFGIAAYISRILDLAWHGCVHTSVANPLAEAARYVDLHYPLQPPVVEPDPIRLLVLGEKDERQEYLEALRHTKDKVKREKD